MRDSSVNRDFLRQVLAGEKQLLKIADVKFVQIPRFDELSVTNLLPRFAADPKVMQYMPDKTAKGKGIDREYFFNVLNTVHPERMAKMIEHANKLRFDGHKGIEQETVVVTEDWWAQLNAMPYFSSKSLDPLTHCHRAQGQDDPPPQAGRQARPGREEAQAPQRLRPRRRRGRHGHGGGQARRRPDSQARRRPDGPGRRLQGRHRPTQQVQEE
jgi:hypothetical protein